MTTSSLRRQVKNIVHNYSEAEIKVREATSNDPWGPSSSLMSEISDLTFNVVAFTEVMGMIWKRLNDSGKNWRHVYKALTLLDYLIKTGSERVAQQCKENVFAIQTLKDFQYVDRDGKDQGVNVREKAKQLVALTRDEDRLKQERAHALKTKERMAGVATSMGSYSSRPPAPHTPVLSWQHAAVRAELLQEGASDRDPTPGSVLSTCTALFSLAVMFIAALSASSLPGGSLERWNSRSRRTTLSASSSSPRLTSDLEQARPQTSGEEELQLQLALAMSREESEKPKPAPPTSLEMDEDTQLQIALSLSKEEHEKEQRSRQGDERLLQRALEESRRESSSGHQESALMDLVDIFGPAPTTLYPAFPPVFFAAGAHSSSPVTVSPWSPTPASSAPSQPWGSKLTQSDPWEPTLRGPSSSPAQAWDSPAHHTGASGSDPFCRLGEGPVERSGLETLSSAQSGSTAEIDLFGEPLPSTQMNGRGCSPESFDLTSLGETLGNPSPRACRTPEAFLGPTAASLVNLDSLIPPNPPAKNRNPFLSVLSAPSPTNPFQSEQPRLTLNQMRPSSGSPQPGPLPYSASLPLPLSSRAGATLPSSLTQPPTSGAPAFTSPAALLDLPSTLPQPLLPLSSATPLSLQPDQLSQNPFM
nr:PREDICTED: epsin-3 [Lepisosteus oculatus]